MLPVVNRLSGARVSKVTKQLAAIDKSLKAAEKTRKLPWIKTGQAQTLFGLVILANAVFMGVEVELSTDDFSWDLWAIETTFLVIFLLEVVLKLAAEFPHIYTFFDAWGTFDLVITLLGCLDTWVFTLLFEGSGNPLSSVTVLRLFRLVRLARLVRLLRMFNQLVVLIETIGSSMMAVAWMSLLLFLIIYSGSIVTVILLGQPYGASDPEIQDYFGDMGNALFSHFAIVTLENWPDMAMAAMNYNKLWAVYFVLMIFIMNFALVNLMVGVIVERIMVLSREQESALASFAAESDMFRETLQTLFNTADLDASGELSREEVRTLLKQPETHKIMNTFGINLQLSEGTLHTIMDLDGDGATSFQEFFDACIRLCGSQQSIHSVYVQHDICRCRHDLGQRLNKIGDVIERLGNVGNIATEDCSSELGPLPAPEEPSEPSALRRDEEAGLGELLDRMQRLSFAQQEMLTELRALREQGKRAPGARHDGEDAGAGNAAGGAGRHTRHDAQPGGQPQLGEGRQPKPPEEDQRAWPEVRQKRGQALDSCCVDFPNLSPTPGHQ